ncbi:PhzF family phenazine biosynthesis isomerase [Leucobacter sp. NPDC058333]|uniref:PhzF family phenazine biosynthesis isomerase n=1 Tax=Leucobacter sp. NPDC058333 TaxID=3346450 RepID=UPI00365CB870
MSHPPACALRPFVEADAAFFASLAADPRVTRYVGDGAIWAEERIRDRVSTALSGIPVEALGAARWFVATDGDESVGVVVSWREADGIEIGYWVSPEHWGRGIASAMVDEALTKVPRVFGTGRLLARVDPENVVSAKLLTRRGFRLIRSEPGCDYFGLEEQAMAEAIACSKTAQPAQSRVPIVQIDAFADAPFEGNPAAVMLLSEWYPSDVLQRIAEENNLSETAFLVQGLPDGALAPNPDHPAYHLRWFTPVVEVALCGHATLAAASYLFEDVHPDATELQFITLSGWLSVTRTETGQYAMDFPSETPAPVAIDPVIAEALGVRVVEALRATDLIYVVENAQTVIGLDPELAVLASLPVRGTIVTARGDDTEYDFVSRWFGAEAGVSEDPVTGSAHCQLAPFWSERLDKRDLLARQVSARGGTVRVTYRGERTLLTGGCVRFMDGTALLPRNAQSNADN